jgi:DNA-binding IclR family transcriptional regulator
MDNKTQNQISVKRVLEVFDILVIDREATFSGIQRKLGGLASTTVSRVLKVMIREGWIMKNEKGLYVFAEKAYDFAKKLLGGVSNGEVLSGEVENLASITQESTAYAEFHENSFTFKAKKEMPSSYHYIDLFVRNQDIFNNGFGIMCLAYQDESLINYLMKKNEDKTSKFNKEAFLRIKTDGFFIYEEPRCLRFIAPVFYGEDRRFAGAIGISKIIKDDKKNYEKYINMVKESAARASKILSHKK